MNWLPPCRRRSSSCAGVEELQEAGEAEAGQGRRSGEPKKDGVDDLEEVGEAEAGAVVAAG
jgi:hypothetical protein